MDKIGKYELIAKIGAGGFASVYKGRDPYLKRLVAIKICSSDDPLIRERFFREAEVAGRLQHRNITTVHDFGLEGEEPYLVQEFLDGEDLEQLILRRSPLSDDEKLDIVVQVALGLEYAHSRGVIHRDIKPANIFRLRNGRVKILDFGIAKLTHAADQLTRTGTTIGTAAYLAPEQLIGGEVTPAADIFSLGVVTYELLSGQRPFQGETLSEVFMQVLHGEPVPLTESWKGCPTAIAQMVARCLAKGASERYPSATALLAVLESIRRGADTETLLAPRGGPGDEPPEPTRLAGPDTAAPPTMRSPEVPAAGSGEREIADRSPSRWRWAASGLAVAGSVVVGLLWWQLSGPGPYGLPRSDPAVPADSEIMEATSEHPPATDTPSLPDPKTDSERPKARREAVPPGAPATEPRPDPQLRETAPPAVEPANGSPSPEVEREPVVLAPPLEVREERSSPPAPEIAAPTQRDASAAIRQVIAAYRDAYSRLDVAGLQRVWPTAPTRNLETAFQDLRALRLDISDCKIEIEAERASANCSMSQESQPRVGSLQRLDSRVVFHLEQRDADWVIVSRDFS